MSDEGMDSEKETKKIQKESLDLQLERRTDDDESTPKEASQNNDDMDSSHCSVSKKTQSSQPKVEELGDDPSDDERSNCRDKDSSVSPEDIVVSLPQSDKAATRVGNPVEQAADTAVAPMGNPVEQAMTCSPALVQHVMNQVGLPNAPMSVDFSLKNCKQYNLGNSPNAVVADTIIQNYNSENKPIDKLLERTKLELKKFDLDAFYETEATKSAMERFQHGVLFLEGPEKSGKTSIAKYILKKHEGKYTPVLVSRPKDLHTLAMARDMDDTTGGGNGEEKKKKKPARKFIICIDDIFTKDHMSGVSDFVDEGLTHVIITSTPKDMKKLKRQSDYGKILKSRYRTKIIDYPLMDHERYEILRCKNKCLRHWDKITGEHEEFLQEVARATNYPWFLSIMDELDYPSQKPGASLSPSFTHPTEFLKKRIREMCDDENEKEREKFIALVIIMKQGFLEERALKSPDSLKPSAAAEICNSLGRVLRIPIPSTERVLEAAKEMIGEYVTLVSRCFFFIHDSLLEAVCQVLFEKSSEHAISLCPLSFLVRSTSDGSDTEYTVLEDCELDFLKKRFSTEDDLMGVFRHQAFSCHDFIKRIIKVLNIPSRQYKDILLQAITLGQSALIQEITRNVLRTLPEGGESIKHLALEKACEVGNFEAFEELIKAEAKTNLACMKACMSGKNQQVVSHVLEKFTCGYYQLPFDLLRDWVGIVAEVGHTRMIEGVIEKIHGRQDKPQLMAFMLQKVITLKDGDKYDLIMGKCQGDSLNWVDILVTACETGQEEILKKILKHLDDQKVQVNLQIPFAAACRSNKRSVAEILMKTDPGLLTMVTPDGETPLQLAADIHHSAEPDLLKWLLPKLGKDTDIDGSAALHCACSRGNISAVNILLKDNFGPPAIDMNGNTPLHTHLIGEFVNMPVVHILLEKEKDIRDPKGTDKEQKGKKEEKKPSTCVQNNDGDTPLHLMCMHLSAVHLSILQAMVRFSEKAVNIENKKRQTPLHVLIASGGPPGGVDIFTEGNADLSIVDEDAQSVLHLACLKGNSKTIKKLPSKLGQSKVVESRNADGWTPLHCYASTPGNTETVQLLLTDKNSKARDAMGQTALHIAVGVPGNSEVVEALIGKGMDVNAVDKWQETPLHVMCRLSLSASSYLELLLKKGANINAKGGKLQTPLHDACLSEGPKSAELVQQVLLKGADIWEKDVYGNTPFHDCCMTCCGQSAKVLNVLIEHMKVQAQMENMENVGRALSEGDKHGDTPLHKVCLSPGQHRKEVAKLLLDEGADISLVNNGGDTALDLSRRNGMTDITQLIIAKTLENCCIGREKLQTVESILSYELSPDVNNEDRLSSMLQRVVSTDGSNTVGVLEKLLTKGANVKCKTAEGYTVIHLAAMTQGRLSENILSYLISRGADVFDRDHCGETALHKVSTGQTRYSITLVTYLTSQGLSVEDMDNGGNTPLHTLFGQLQLGKHYRDIMTELLTLGSDVDLPNKQERTPSHLAKHHGKQVIGDLFETYCTKLKVLKRHAINHLISCGAEINRMDSEGNTVLHKVCMKRVSLVCNNVKILLELGANKCLYNTEGKTAFDYACDTGLDEDVRLLTVVEMPDDIDTDGATPGSTPRYSPSSPISPQLPCPEWFRRSSSTESWEGDFRRGMLGIRNAAGMRYFDEQMDEFENQARYKQRTFFKRNM